ncbi:MULTISPECIES: rRNA biogenesis protein rrp5 [Streptococcus]|mgnify:CR=1 FL=1|jgi:rRNA biogenesis protein rrp5, putative|uniref:rRNA biogenesis protein rrp5 n=1 Tax=Streptococcus TaxID=1301 RepID=UPI001CC0C1CC|nr:MULTISPECIES: rRNA biogenesis protein rrp5 [Streptococcus]MBZ2134839.1 rRNA biogenesis protein rrp5 [Streptococcus gordonii]MCC3172185.1 putative rRNA biogenesis protein rrp5 [Streptococcus sanguinis]
MAQMKKLETVVSNLRMLADSLEELCDAVDVTAEAPTKQVEKVTLPTTVTIEDIRKVLAEKSRAGKTEQVRELLQKYGANKLSAVDEQHYASLLEDAKGL